MEFAGGKLLDTGGERCCCRGTLVLSTVLLGRQGDQKRASNATEWNE